MAKKFCVFPPGFSESAALDCDHGHRHLSKREADEGLAAGKIVLLDEHQDNKRPRYMVVETDGVDKSKTFERKWSATAIPAGLSHRAAGAHFPEASDREQHASEKVEAYNEIYETEQGHHWVVLSDVTYDGEDVWIGLEPMKDRRPVRVALRTRTPEAMAAAAVFYVKRYQKGKGSFDQFLSAMREMRESLKELDRAWPQMVVRFAAGPWTTVLSRARPGKLPSEILRQVLQAYLHLG